MKKVIIITRDTADTYHKDCKACKEFTNKPCIDGKQKIHDYITRHILDLVDSINNDEDSNLKIVWNNLSKKGVLPSFDIVWGRGTEGKKSYDEQYERYLGIYPNTSLELVDFKTRKISKNLAKVLKSKQIDNKPYVYLKNENNKGKKTDVYFVFLNRIFDIFVYGSEEYGALVNDNSRLDFIKAICQDCELIDEEYNLNGEKAILYIHDKEWYKSDETFSVLLNDKDVPNQKIYVAELKNYFSTIKVFQHTPNHIFNEIKELNFTEEDCEVKLLEREYF